MGSQQSRKRDQIVEIIEQYETDKRAAISQKEFTQYLFRKLDLAPKHNTYGPLIVTGSHVLKRLYGYIRSQNRGQFNKVKIMDVVKECFDDPKVAIDYSYRIVQPLPETNISKTLFIEFITQCFSRAVTSIMKEYKSDEKFKKKFTDWVNSNNFKIAEAAQALFNQHAQSERDEWTRGDFKRWILSNSEWTIQANIKDTVYSVPLNIPCLFGILLEPQKKK